MNTKRERLKKDLSEYGASHVRDNRRNTSDSYSFYLVNKHYYDETEYRNNITQLLWLCDYREHINVYYHTDDQNYGGNVLYVKRGHNWNDTTNIGDDLHNIWFHIISPMVLDVGNFYE